MDYPCTESNASSQECTLKEEPRGLEASEAKVVLFSWCRVCSAFLHGNSISQITQCDLHLLAQFVVWFLCSLARETRHQAAISRRSRANVFDVLKALQHISPLLTTHILHDETVVKTAPVVEALLRKINRTLPLWDCSSKTARFVRELAPPYATQRTVLLGNSDTSNDIDDLDAGKSSPLKWVPAAFDLTPALDSSEGGSLNDQDMPGSSGHPSDDCTTGENYLNRETTHQSRATINTAPSSLRDILRKTEEAPASQQSAYVSSLTYSMTVPTPWPSHFPPLPSSLLTYEPLIPAGNVEQDRSGKYYFEATDDTFSLKDVLMPRYGGRSHNTCSVNDALQPANSFQARLLEDHLHVQLLLPKIVEQHVSPIYSAEEEENAFCTPDHRDFTATEHQDVELSLSVPPDGPVGKHSRISQPSSVITVTSAGLDGSLRNLFVL